MVDELVHEGHAAGPSPHYQVVAGEGGHLLQVLQFVKNLRSFFRGKNQPKISSQLFLCSTHFKTLFHCMRQLSLWAGQTLVAKAFASSSWYTFWTLHTLH